MSELTDFLLARIAEDEAWAHECLAAGDRSSQRGHYVGGTLVALFTSPEDALEILEAKRAALVDNPDLAPFFAQAYAEHPEYDAPSRA